MGALLGKIDLHGVKHGRLYDEHGGEVRAVEGHGLALSRFHQRSVSCAQGRAFLPYRHVDIARHVVYTVQARLLLLPSHVRKERRADGLYLYQQMPVRRALLGIFWRCQTH